MIALVKETKICGGCGQEKPATIAFFCPNAMGKNGLHSKCRVCHNAHGQKAKAKIYWANPEQARALGRRYAEESRRRKGQYVRAEHRVERVHSLEKQCARCGETKPKAAFPMNPTLGTLDKLSSYCRECTKLITQETADRKDWRARVLGSALRRHVEMGHHAEEFDLTTEFLDELFLVQGGECFWFKVPMLTARKSGPAQVTLDRIDNNVGYVQANVVFASKAANLARNTATFDEFKEFVARVLKM